MSRYRSYYCGGKYFVAAIRRIPLVVLVTSLEKVTELFWFSLSLSSKRLYCSKCFHSCIPNGRHTYASSTAWKQEAFDMMRFTHFVHFDRPLCEYYISRGSVFTRTLTWAFRPLEMIQLFPFSLELGNVFCNSVSRLWSGSHIPSQFRLDRKLWSFCLILRARFSLVGVRTFVSLSSSWE